MKIVLYNDEYEVLEVMENIHNLSIGDNYLKWDTGEMGGLKCNFIVLKDDESIDDQVTHDHISKDQKGNFVRIDLFAENAILKMENEMNAMAIMELTQIILTQMALTQMLLTSR